MSAYAGFEEDDIGDAPIVVTFAACHQGQPRPGVEHSWMSLAGADVVSSGTLVDFRDHRKFSDPVRGSVLMSRNISRALGCASRRLSNASVASLCFGGDHTISIGTVMATRAQHPHTRLVWIDAHPDINSPDTSLSGNCHGMPVSHLLGLVDNFAFANVLQSHELAYIGLRCVDDAESLRLQHLRENGGLVFTSADVQERGMTDILSEISSKWGNADASTFDFPVHVSLDIDSMDPLYTPATGTPVANGLTPGDVAMALRFFNQKASGGLCHLDVVELNPYLCSAREAATTVRTTQQVLAAWLSSHKLLRHSIASTQPL